MQIDNLFCGYENGGVMNSVPTYMPVWPYVCSESRECDSKRKNYHEESKDVIGNFSMIKVCWSWICCHLMDNDSIRFDQSQSIERLEGKKVNSISRLWCEPFLTIEKEGDCVSRCKSHRISDPVWSQSEQKMKSNSSKLMNWIV
jgi:hypothetical protein